MSESPETNSSPDPPTYEELLKENAFLKRELTETREEMSKTMDFMEQVLEYKKRMEQEREQFKEKEKRMIEQYSGELEKVKKEFAKVEKEMKKLRDTKGSKGNKTRSSKFQTYIPPPKKSTKPAPKKDEFNSDVIKRRNMRMKVAALNAEAEKKKKSVPVVKKKKKRRLFGKIFTRSKKKKKTPGGSQKRKNVLHHLTGGVSEESDPFRSQFEKCINLKIKEFPEWNEEHYSVWLEKIKLSEVLQGKFDCYEVDTYDLLTRKISSNGFFFGVPFKDEVRFVLHFHLCDIFKYFDDEFVVLVDKLMGNEKHRHLKRSVETKEMVKVAAEYLKLFYDKHEMLKIFEFRPLKSKDEFVVEKGEKSLMSTDLTISIVLTSCHFASVELFEFVKLEYTKSPSDDDDDSKLKKKKYSIGLIIDEHLYLDWSDHNIVTIKILETDDESENTEKEGNHESDGENGEDEKDDGNVMVRGGVEMVKIGETILNYYKTDFEMIVLALKNWNSTKNYHSENCNAYHFVLAMMKTSGIIIEVDEKFRSVMEVIKKHGYASSLENP